jgi:hypothetical protein
MGTDVFLDPAFPALPLLTLFILVALLACHKTSKDHPMTMRSLLSHIGAQWGKAKIKKQSEIYSTT